MGLDVSHDAWHGAYSAFNRWREKVADVSGLPPLELMEGYYSEDSISGNPFSLLDMQYPKGDELAMSALRRIRVKLPIKWNSLKPSPLLELLTHSDCDGYINWKSCGRIGEELYKVAELMPDEEGGGHICNWKEKTKRFADGCMKAFNNKEKLIFR